MARKMADCRRFESDANCTLTIIGEQDEVVTAATQHAIASHGHEDTPGLRERTPVPRTGGAPARAPFRRRAVRSPACSSASCASAR